MAKFTQLVRGRGGLELSVWVYTREPKGGAGVGADQGGFHCYCLQLEINVTA